MFDIITRFSHARILVADDSVFDRRLILTALKKLGFSRIDTADDGVEALQKTHDLRPDLVLLDLRMPNLDGFGYCEAVRNDSELPRMPIIVQTALGDRASRLRALACGADDYLTKPLDMDELSLRICVQIERYFMMRDLEDMCGYLKMEVEQCRNMRQHVHQTELPAHCRRFFDNHYEVLEQLAHLPTVL
ncbi:MAG: response regulator [Alphaproteobacteria bacterium]|nr:response regulator [Alphaproteobacteria bacterium]